MRVMAQMAMVMNLDKCIGCHTCSVTCKQAWTNRAGTEYVWFNNVETRPGLGYPRTYEDQETWQGGWVRKPNGRLALKAGGRIKKLLNIFSNPKLPSIQDYYEPWTYDYETLLNSPQTDTFPVARPKSLISGENMNVEWSANWDDDLGGSQEHAARDEMLKGIEDKVKFEFEQTFMFYLPRICEHCLNPSCAASCPSGAIYKREEDGIVLVDQDRCRGWRMCVSGCPYKKVYFNHKTGKAEKCTFCYPRIEVGIPTVCSETCVGRLRYIGLVLYDADKVLEAASIEDEHALYDAQRACFLDPEDPEVQRAAEAAGIPGDWVEAAKKSPVWALINKYEVALPLHPEYRTMPMVWYIPPLSPVVDVVKDTGEDAEDRGNLFAAIEALRIPVEYLANLFTAGDPAPVDGVLRKLAAMRSYMRDINLGRDPDDVDPRGRRDERRVDVRDVPPARDRQVQRALRHPYRARRAGARARGARHRLPGQRLRRRAAGPLRRGLGLSRPRWRWRTSGCCRTGRPRRPATSSSAGGPRRDGSTCSTGTAAAPPRVCSHPPPPATRAVTRDALPRTRRRRRRRRCSATWAACSALLDYPTEELLAEPRRPRGPGARTTCTSAVCSTTCARTTCGRCRRTTSRPSTTPASARSTSPTTPTATPVAAGPPWCSSSRPTAAAAVQWDEASGELPDHLCAVLQFGAAVDADVAWQLLNEHRAGIEMLRIALAGWRNHDGSTGSPWHGAVRALCATLPDLAGDEAEAVRRLIEQGPPVEEVGLDGYGADPAIEPARRPRRSSPDRPSP